MNCPIKTLLLLICCVLQSNAQKSISTFGFFQTTYTHQVRNQTLTNSESSLQSTESAAFNSFNVQQLSTFARIQIGNRLTGWINFELTNSFSTSELLEESYTLEEVWLRYVHSRSLKLKAGLLIPKFNLLNEVKNRMPYLPFIVRPLVYEESFADLIPTDGFLPQETNLQLYGYLPAGRKKLDYSLYFGSGGSEYEESESGPLVGFNADSSLSFMVGGTVGLQFDNLRAGLSFSSDRLIEDDVNVRRLRTGADLTISLGRLDLEGEAILVRHDGAEGSEMDKMFYYGYAGCHLTDQLLGYTYYNFMSVGDNDLFSEGVRAYSAGLMLKPHESIALKTQFTLIELNEIEIEAGDENYLNDFPLDLMFKTTQFNLALSVYF